MTKGNETHVGADVGAGRDFVGRDNHRDQYNAHLIEEVRNQSGSAQVSVAAGHDEWMTAQIVTITNQLAQMSQKLKKLDQIDEALIGSRLRGERGLVADVQRLWTVVIGIVVFLALLGVVEAAQWVLLWRLMSLL